MRSSGWISKVLDEVVDIFGGGTPKTSASEYWGGDIPWLSVKDFNDDTRVVYHTEKSITSLGLMNSAARVLDEGDVVISARGTVGEVTQLGRPMAFNQSCYGLRGKRGQLDNTYLYYLLRHKVRDFNQRSHGSVFSTITRDTFRGIHVLLPEVDEQTAIAATLSCLDDKIELNNRMNKTLEEMAQALFKSWFVDFDPVKAKMEGREPAGMDAETAALFPDEFEDSELGMIPKGWRVGPLEQLGKVVGGSTPSKAIAGYYCDDGGIPWITPKDLSTHQGKFVSRGSINITELGFRNSSTAVLPRGSVLFSSRAPIGYMAVALNDVTTNQGFKSIIPGEGIGTEFVYNTLNQSRELIDARAVGSTFKEISGSAMKSIPVMLPGSRALSAFGDRVGALTEMQINLEDENANLVTLRDTLLPKLMSGEIRVPEAEDILEEVL